MSFDVAMRWSEVLLGWAILQQSAEHMVGPGRERILFAPRLLCGVGLVLGVYPGVMLVVLCGLGVWMLMHFQGPYNGGSDRMALLITICLALAHWLPGAAARELAFAYLAGQLMLSYAVSGWVKLANREWRSGRALADVFAFSTYPVSTEVRRLAGAGRMVWGASWAVMIFEALFPLAMVSRVTLVAALGIAAAFHLANACLFGLNRFFWTWIAAFPAILWLHARVTGGEVW